MELISLPRLRVNQLQSVSERSLEICSSLTEMQPSTEKVKITLDEFVKGMLKEQASAKEKKELDLTRDRLVSGFLRHVQSEQLFPHNNEKLIAALQQLVMVVNKYGTKINRLSYEEESVAIDNMLADLDQIDLTPLQDTGIPRWLTPLEQSNNAFKSASGEYITDSVEASLTNSASTSAPALIDALEGMYSMLYAHIKINPSEALKKAYLEIQTYLASFK
jgi:hypothetical protein